jgi:predicted acylesterase/phospholipase RssA
MATTLEQKLRQYPPDILIRPELPTNVNAFAGYERATELAASGERAAQACLPEIKALLRPRWQWLSGQGEKRYGKDFTQPPSLATCTD